MRTPHSYPHFKARLIATFVHTLWLLLLTIGLQYTSLIRLDEISFFKTSFILKKLIAFQDRKPLGDRVLFLDVSKDLSLINDPAGYPGAKTTIKDRLKLAKFFKLLRQHPGSYQFVLCDVLFSDRSPEDTALKKEIEELPKFITTSIIEKNVLVRPVFNVKSACVNYQPVNQSTFVKMPLFINDTLKSLPAVLCELTDSKRFTRHNGLTFISGKPSFNYIIPDFYYRPLNMSDGQIYPLGKLLLFPDSVILHKITGKWLVIGDFSNDQHNTYISSIPGAFILFNAYLTLKYTNAGPITWTWLLLMAIVYFIVSFRIIFRKKTKVPQIGVVSKYKFLKKVLVKYFSYLGICILLNILSYFFFGIFISMFYTATYLAVFEYLIEKRAWIRRKFLTIFRLT